MYANKSAIPMTPRRGRNGHIRLIMDTEVYVNLSTTAYTRPTEPGPYAQHGVSNTAAAHDNANAIHKEARRVYDIDKNVDDTLKQEVIAEEEETYISAKKNRVT